MTEIQDQDQDQRTKALNPRQSFIVQAPAGSGKTELIAQRFLVLLNHVNQPEEILAITFTKKSAAEMRTRIIEALSFANSAPEPEQEHAKKTWQLAKQALQRDKLKEWNLLSNPNRLRIQTIDSFNASLIKHLPILSHFGAPPEITTDSHSLYQQAVQEFLSHLEENVEWSEAIAKLLIHLDNDLEKCETLFINMLAKRDQWLRFMLATPHEKLRSQFEKQVADVIIDLLTALDETFPAELKSETLSLLSFAANNLISQSSNSSIVNCCDLIAFPKNSLTDYVYWQAFSHFFLTTDNNWRKRIDTNLGFPAPSNSKNSAEKKLYAEMKERCSQLIEKLTANETLHSLLIEVKNSPSLKYENSQWEILQALYLSLRIIVAQLKIVFQNTGKIDYIENSQAALFALGTEDTPTDLALALDYQIRHILIDEFQDTSNSQYQLLEKLMMGWEKNDGRTLFIVGDPMQSIYRFREAEVGLFIRSRQHGIANIKLEPLVLSVNFRSTETIVNWVNTHFQKVFPENENISSGAVTYSNSTAFQEATNDSLVELHASENSERKQADEIVELILRANQSNPQQSIAILVRSRNHLEHIIPALKKSSIAYQAIDIDALHTRPIIQDLMALTRALLHPADRIAWLAILRAPWCGLTLADLLILAEKNSQKCLWELLNEPTISATLSHTGNQRLARIIPILKEKINDRRRYNLRSWIESTWYLLGGPACVEAVLDLDDANTFFNLLEQLDEGCDLANFEKLQDQVEKLYAAANHQSDANVKIMTIHNSKGLEFDTVIIPHLERKSPHDEKQILLWMEYANRDGKNGLLLAPMHGIGNENDKIYEYIKRQQAIKINNEYARLLYVAATRAKQQLHLFFTLESTEQSPPSKSLLEKLWPAIKNEIHFSAQELPAHSITRSMNQELHRLILDWENPLKENVTHKLFSRHQKAPGFILSQKPKYIGVMVHQILQQIAILGIDWWTKQSQDSQETYCQHHLIQLGMLASELTSSCTQIKNAIANTLSDERGKWILKSHMDAQSEFALTAIINNQPRQLVIDRTFIDESDTRWIIDYKTSILTQGELQDFLKAEQKKYLTQMQHYLTAMQFYDARKIRLGLYFPMLSSWVEYTSLELISEN